MTNTKWVNFKNREGPVVHGVHSYKLPDAPTEREIFVAAAVACEEGSYDDVNMYDRGIVSVGLFQWIEANYSIMSTLLGLVCDAGHSEHVQTCLEEILKICNAKFVKGPVRWHFVMDGKPIDEINSQKKLFYGCEGTIGSWTPETRGRAILWAESLASIWDEPEVRKIQNKFAVDRISQYAFKTSKIVLFGPNAPVTSYATAVKAIYLALAINAPGTADAIVMNFVRKNRLKEWSEMWCNELLKELATTKLLPNFAKRYTKARFVVNAALGVNLPETFTEIVVVQKAVIVTNANVTQEIKKTSLDSPKIIQLEAQDIVVPVPKTKSIINRVMNIFRR